MKSDKSRLPGIFFAILLFSVTIQNFAVTPQDIVDTALTMKGGIYEWGADDPTNRAFDCWSFVDWVYRTAFEGEEGMHSLKGYDDSDLMWVYWNDPDELLSGDVLTNGGEHSMGFHGAIYMGGGMTVEARGRIYGIGSWSVEGTDRYAPYGQTGYRFCYYSLLARLWTHPRPDFVYAYIKNTPDYVFGGEPYKLEIVCNLPRSLKHFPYSLIVDVFDYVHPDRLLESKIQGIEDPGMKKFEMKLVSPSKDTIFVFYKVSLFDSGGSRVFEENTRIGKATQIM